MAKYEVSINGKTYEVEIVSDDGQHAVVNVDGKQYEVNARSVTSGPSYSYQQQAPAPAENAPDTKSSALSPSSDPDGAATSISTPLSRPGGGREILAPMPGVILEIKVSVGSKVKPGDVVARMEAMKMENDIKSDVEGTVKEVVVQKGDGVQERDVILVLEE